MVTGRAECVYALAEERFGDDGRGRARCIGKRF